MVSSDAWRMSPLTGERNGESTDAIDDLRELLRGISRSWHLNDGIAENNRLHREGACRKKAKWSRGEGKQENPMPSFPAEIMHRFLWENKTDVSLRRRQNLVLAMVQIRGAALSANHVGPVSWQGIDRPARVDGTGYGPGRRKDRPTGTEQACFSRYWEILGCTEGLFASAKPATCRHTVDELEHSRGSLERRTGNLYRPTATLEV